MSRHHVLIGALILAAAGLAGCTGGSNAGRAKHTKPADYHLAVLLFPKAGGTPNDCDALTEPASLSVGKNDMVTWEIVNLCGNTQDIEIKDFAGDNGHDNPLETQPGGDPKRRLIFKVKANADYDVYKYSVYRGGVKVEDPELDVER
jgi:hypothetical protein